jgi:hypothetical protein
MSLEYRLDTISDITHHNHQQVEGKFVAEKALLALPPTTTTPTQVLNSSNHPSFQEAISSVRCFPSFIGQWAVLGVARLPVSDCADNEGRYFPAHPSVGENTRRIPREFFVPVYFPNLHSRSPFFL